MHTRPAAPDSINELERNSQEKGRARKNVEQREPTVIGIPPVCHKTFLNQARRKQVGQGSERRPSCEDRRGANASYGGTHDNQEQQTRPKHLTTKYRRVTRACREAGHSVLANARNSAAARS